MKLARKIILLLLAMFLALLGTFAVIDAGRAVRTYDAFAIDEMAVTGRALRPPIGEVLAVEGEDRALGMLQRADAEFTHVEMRWVRLDAADEAPLTPAQVEKLRRGDEVAVGRGAREPDRVYFYEPVSETGAIEISRTLDPERDVILHRLRERLGVAIVAAMFAAALSIVAGVRLVGHPMNQLVEHARRIGEGNLAHRPDLGRSDEIGELSEEMNRMCDQLEEAQKRIAAEADARVAAVEQLRRADRLSTVGRLASGMAHELGTPLSIVGGRAKMIASGEPPKEEAAQYARVILAQAEKMTRIMRGLLDFARRKPVEKSPADVSEIVRRTVELLTPLAKRSQVALVLEDGGGPNAANVDVAQVEQALANLVVNGIHAMPSGGDLVVRTERMRARPPNDPAAPLGDYLRVRVIDQGSGIAAEHLPHVFEPFFTTKEIGEGTGLGLSVTYGIMQEHGGFVDVESEPGKGSAFSLYFRTEGAPS